MIYLIAKMSLYLAIALLAGFGAGWLMRNLMAARREEEIQRTLSETRSRVPQFESLMRTRDEQTTALRREVKDKDARIGELHAEISTRDKTLKTRERELQKAQSRLAALDVDEGVDDVEFKHLEREVERLRQQEQRLAAELHAARAGEPATASPAAGSSAMEEVLRSELHDLESRLRQTTLERDRLSKALELEKRRVTELERERELQNRSLLVLHQQLEFARENDKRATS